MGVDIVTKEDLHIFRLQIIEDIKAIIAELHSKTKENVEGYKTKHVRKILDCSINKLQTLRISGKIRCKKIGGTVYYNKIDVTKLLEEEFR